MLWTRVLHLGIGIIGSPMWKWQWTSRTFHDCLSDFWLLKKICSLETFRNVCRQRAGWFTGNELQGCGRNGFWSHQFIIQHFLTGSEENQEESQDIGDHSWGLNMGLSKYGGRLIAIRQQSTLWVQVCSPAPTNQVTNRKIWLSANGIHGSPTKGLCSGI